MVQYHPCQNVHVLYLLHDDTITICVMLQYHHDQNLRIGFAVTQYCDTVLFIRINVHPVDGPFTFVNRYILIEVPYAGDVVTGVNCHRQALGGHR